MTEEECHLVERVMEQKFVDTKQQEQKKEVNSVVPVKCVREYAEG